MLEMLCSALLLSTSRIIVVHMLEMPNEALPQLCTRAPAARDECPKWLYEPLPSTGHPQAALVPRIQQRAPAVHSV